MNKIDSKKRVQAIRDYLDAVGSPVSSVQGYELLARALGFKNKHVLQASMDEATSPTVLETLTPATIDIEGTLVRILGLGDGHFPVAKMQEMDWEFDVVVPFPLDRMEDIEAKNSFASERITGNDCALQDIGYYHIPEINFGEGYVAIRVTGYVTAPEDFFDVESDSDIKFYEDLGGLLQRIKFGTLVEVTASTESFIVSIDSVNAEAMHLLEGYARWHGANNELVNDHLETVVFTASGTAGPLTVTVDQLKYATRSNPTTWHTHVLGSAVLWFKS
jgi:hypothetical protein